MDLVERACGCFIGAAHGDALGAPNEGRKLAQIHEIYGPNGITKYEPFSWPGEAVHPAGSWTDDTQMAVATAEAIIRTAEDNCNHRGIFNYDLFHEYVWEAYVAWYNTQSDPGQRRGPGKQCLRSLGNRLRGTIQTPLNEAMGCGGVMRAYPVGIAYVDPQIAFKVGINTAVMTHGHPNAYYPSGMLAMLISLLLNKADLSDAYIELLNEMAQRSYTDNENVGDSSCAYCQAHLAHSNDTLDPLEAIETRVGHRHSPKGGGWLGHDALAIGVYCALYYKDDPIRAVQLSANHSGDTDSTASITGAIMGAIHGSEPFLEHICANGDTLERMDYLINIGKSLVSYRQ